MCIPLNRKPGVCLHVYIYPDDLLYRKLGGKVDASESWELSFTEIFLFLIDGNGLIRISCSSIISSFFREFFWFWSQDDIVAVFVPKNKPLNIIVFR